MLFIINWIVRQSVRHSYVNILGNKIHEICLDYYVDNYPLFGPFLFLVLVLFLELCVTCLLQMLITVC